MKTIFTLLLICSATVACAQIKENPTTNENTIEKKSEVEQIKKETKRKSTDTLKMIFERIDAVHQLISKQEEKIASEYKRPMEELKKQHHIDDSLLFSKSMEIGSLNETISGLNDLIKMKDEQVGKLTKDAANVKNEIVTKQALNDQLAQQINLQIGLLKNAPYSTDPLWIDQLINTCNQFVDKSKIPNYIWLNDFKSKSSAITFVMNKIQNTRFLKNTDLNKIKEDLYNAYGKENSNFITLKNDFQVCNTLLKNYSTTYCEVSKKIDIAVIGMKSFQESQRIDFLYSKCYLQVNDFPILKSVLDEVIKSGFTINPLKGKIDCE